MNHANDNGEGIRFLSVCSGIEAASVAFGPLGWKAVAFSEIEKFPSAVLAHHYPDVPNLGDFTTIDTTKLGRVDILCGGTPCQSFSVAGLRRSLDDARGNLTLSFVRLAHELADGNGLRNAIWENVPGVLSTKDNAFGCFLGALVGGDDALSPPSGRRWPNAGMVSGPQGRAAWRIQDAQFHGLAQRRRRVVVVADFGNGADPAAVLFELYGVQGNTPPRRETRKDVAAYSASSIGSYREAAIGGAVRAAGGDNGGGSENLVAFAPEIARCDATREGSSQDYETTTMVAVDVVPIDMRQASRGATMTNNRKEGQSGGAPGTGIGESGDPSPTISTSHTPAVCVTGETTHALTAEGHDASEDGSGRGAPIVSVMHETGQGWWKEEDVAGTLRAEGENRPSRPSHVIGFDPRATDVPVTGDITGVLDASYPGPAICFTAKDYGADAQEEVSPTLRAGWFTGSHANGWVMPAVAFMTRGSNIDTNGEVSGTLGTNADRASGGAPMVAHTVAIRGRDGGATAELGGEVATALRASQGGGDKPHVLTSAVRRLTPRECERLQGFQWLCSPDYPGAWQDDAGRWWSPDYTDIPWRGKPASQCPDGPRYKSLGNSWAVPMFIWLGRRISAHMPARVTNARTLDHKAAA